MLSIIRAALLVILAGGVLTFLFLTCVRGARRWRFLPTTLGFTALIDLAFTDAQLLRLLACWLILRLTWQHRTRLLATARRLWWLVRVLWRGSRVLTHRTQQTLGPWMQQTAAQSRRLTATVLLAWALRPGRTPRRTAQP